MNKPAYAVAAAALVVALGGALLLTRPGSDAGSGTGPTPSAPPSAAASPSAGGSLLTGRWMGGPNDLVAEGAGSSILIDDDGHLELAQSNNNSTVKLTAQVSFTNAGLIHLADSELGPCAAQTGGDYDWTHSPSDRVITLSPIEDGCTQRATALAGTWWKMGCTTDGDNCLGLLDAGTYKSQFIAPHVDPGGEWAPVFGALTYTVPEDWANASDWPESFELVPAAELPPVSEANRRRNIGIFTQPTAMSQDRPCSDEVVPGVGPTVDDLVTWLGTVDGLVMSEPAPVAIGGRAGQSLDLQLDPSWTATCEGESEPLLTFLNPGIAVGGEQRVRLILLDLGDADVVAIGVWTRDQATFDAFIPEAMSVIDSFTFE